jgi:hypothetical protein
MSDTTVNKISASYVASEIWDVSTGFKVLVEYLHSMRSTKAADNDELLEQTMWVAQKIESELTEAVKHAEALDDVTNGRTPNRADSNPTGIVRGAARLPVAARDIMRSACKIRRPLTRAEA